jgi:hypothetical protein
MQTANAFTTQDAAEPKNNSPLAYGPATVTLAVPANALRLILAPSTTLKVSEDSELSRYYLVPSGTQAEFDVASLENVFIQQYATPGTVNFRFATA